jgi:hypothetical protein
VIRETQRDFKETMTTAKKTIPAESEETRRPHARPFRAFAWSPFTVIPKHETQKVIGLSDSAKRVWLVLVLASGGFSPRIEFTNERLMATAGIANGHTFRDARRELQNAKMLTATAVPGSRKERYLYDIAPNAQKQRQPKPKVKIKRRATTPTVARRHRSDVDDALASNPRVNSWGE